MSDQERKRVPPPRPLPEWIRFEMHVNGARRTVEIPKAHADTPVPFCPVLTFDMMHGARVFVTRGPA